MSVDSLREATFTALPQSSKGMQPYDHVAMALAVLIFGAEPLVPAVAFGAIAAALTTALQLLVP